MKIFGFFGPTAVCKNFDFEIWADEGTRAFALPRHYSYDVNIFNLLKSNAVLTYNNTFVPGGPWLPLAVLTPRLWKVTAALDW